MKYGSVCSGIEAATEAWKPLGWEAQFFSEIELFPCAVLKHHYPEVPNFGDMTKYKEWPDADINVLVGGTPCQSFSVAGLRKGIADPRGNLMLTFGAIAKRYKPRWILWENVPGVLSVNGGRDFGTFIGMLGQLGYGFAYRILNSEHFGIPQRRRRVFVVGYFGDWRRAAAVLFESESMSGDSPPSRKTGEKVAPTVTGGAPYSRTGNERVEVEALVMATGQGGAEISNNVMPTLNCNHENPILTIPGNWIGRKPENGGNSNSPMVDISPALTATDKHAVSLRNIVRRITPTECERLQGFPDGYTCMPWRNKPATNCPDAPRYKALGNSMAVPVMRWIGERIKLINNLER